MTQEDRMSFIYEYLYGDRNRAFRFLKSRGPLKIYKYQSTLHDFTNPSINKLWISRASEFNDPYDCALLYKDKESTEFKHEMLVGCFSEINNSILMWSHYANNHKGFCVEYDFYSMPPLLPVIYDAYYWGIEGFGKAKSDGTLKVLRKAKEWEYEREWRFFIYNHTHSDNLDIEISEEEKGFLLDGPKPTGVYLGCRAKENSDLSAVIKQYCLKEQIPLYCTKLHPYKFEIVVND